VSPESSAYTIFNNALELDDSAARVRYVEEACAGDAALYERVTKLLQADGEAGGFFSQPLKRSTPGEPAATVVEEKAGDAIGRYKLLEQIGEGGCGVVYMAEQQEPVRRRVALKVIKLGLDTKQVIARFEAERQALALMDHPNIAKVLDGGATRTGRPYFVMELVRGTRITKFCDDNKLSTEGRLRLFVQVCQAIQHAHQKGVIHRDIKPSNILVTINDGVPVPKVIDFGLAKATAGRLTDQTLFTAFEQFIGTPAYMSPEQAVMTSVDIDTRTDLYSLGVLLYELLTGRTPFDQQRLLAAGLDGMRRIIQEDKPRRPSTCLSTMAAGALTATAQRRHTEAPTLLHLVRGDLDWIVMKCLEKDRARRYPTANGLALDIERHLNCEPVIARPPSRLYEFWKMVRRHKVEFAAATTVIIALAVGLGISIWTLAKERRTRERAVTAEHETEQQLYTALLEQGRATVQSRELGQRVRTLDAIRRAAAISNSTELRREAFAALAQPDLRFERKITTDPYGTLVELDPRFEQMALCRQENPVEIRATADQRLIATLPASTNRGAASAEWSRDSRFLAVNRGETVIEIWDAANVRPLSSLSGASYGPVSFHPTQPRILSLRSEDEVTIRDLERDLEMNRFRVGGVPLDLRFSDDGNRFAVVYQSVGGWTLDVHDAAAGRVQSSLRFDYMVRSFAWHPQGRWIAVPDSLGDVHLADSQTGETRVLGRHKSQAVYAIFQSRRVTICSAAAQKMS
jgi:serine/threonine protein kinase